MNYKQLYMNSNIRIYFKTLSLSLSLSLSNGISIRFYY